MNTDEIRYALESPSDTTMLRRYSTSLGCMVVIQYLGNDESLAEVPLWFLRQFLAFVYLSESALHSDLPQSLPQPDTRT